MTRSNNKQLLRINQLIPKAIKILPRLPYILFYIRKALKIKNTDQLSIGTILEKNAIKYADEDALMFEDTRYTHRKLNEAINQFANFFISEGIRREQVVVLYLTNRVETLLLVGALAKIGAIASLVNPNQKGDTLRHSIRLDVGKHIIVGEECLADFIDIKDFLELSSQPVFYFLADLNQADCPEDFVDFKKKSVTYSVDNPIMSNPVRAGERFANIFTSGTTGLPKAAIQTHRRWLQLYYWFGKVNLNLTSKDVLYIPIPFFHSNALMVGWASAASAGATIAMRRKFSTTEFWKDVHAYNVSSFVYIGEVCRYLLNSKEDHSNKAHRIKKIVGNGLRSEIWIDFKEHFGIPDILEFYGSAEGNIAFTNTFNVNSSVGWTPAKYAVVKYDTERDQLTRNYKGFSIKVKKGEDGLLLSHISKKTPLSGYLSKSETEKKIIRNVFKKGDAWFNTGDLVREIGFRHAQFVDRLGDTFRWKGENVSTTEVEKIINQYEAIDISSVYGVAIPGADGKAGMVAIQPNEKWSHEKWSHHQIIGFRQWMENHLPSYSIPLFIRLCNGFDMTETHKIKKSKLKEEGFDIRKFNDLVFVSIAQSNYIQLTMVHLSKIESGGYHF